MSNCVKIHTVSDGDLLAQSFTFVDVSGRAALLKLVVERLGLQINEGDVVDFCYKYICYKGTFVYYPPKLNTVMGDVLPLNIEVLGSDNKPLNYYSEVSNLVLFDQRPYLKEILENLTVKDIVAHSDMRYPTMYQVVSRFTRDKKVYHIESHRCVISRIDNSIDEFKSTITDQINGYTIINEQNKLTLLPKSRYTLLQDDVTTRNKDNEQNKSYQAELEYHVKWLKSVEDVLVQHLISDLTKNISKYLDLR